MHHLLFQAPLAKLLMLDITGSWSSMWFLLPESREIPKIPENYFYLTFDQ